MTFGHSKLANGINIVTFNMPYVNSVAINIIVKVGSRYESLAESGLSHFLEHMAFKGTKSRTAEKIAEEFDTIGGHFNAYTSREQTVYYAKVLSENFGIAVDILADILQNSLFDKTDIEKELNVIIQEIAGTNDNPDDLVYEKFYALAFKDQIIGRSILGNTDNLKKFTKDDFLKFMANHYTTSNIYISVAGNIKHNQVVKLVDQRFVAFSDSQRQNLVPATYVGGFEYINKNLEQSSIALGFKGVSYMDSFEYYSAQILSIILGGGLSSRLFQKIREDLGLAYLVGSFCSAYSDVGIFSIYAGADHKNINSLFDNLFIEIQKIQDNISEKELQRAKSQIKTNMLMAEERPEYKSEDIGKNFAIFNRYFSSNELLAIIMNITPKDLTTIAQKIFASKPTISIIGDIPLESLSSLAAHCN